MAESKYISAPQFSRELGLTRDQMIYRCRKGHIRNERVGRAWIIPRTELTRVPTTPWFKAMQTRQAAA